jgi:hypothetical protein
MADDFLARHIVPILEAVSWMNTICRENWLHDVLRISARAESTIDAL